jgi:hypothetical protein
MPTIRISYIAIPEFKDLKQPKLLALHNSFDKFEAQLNSVRDPIALDLRSGIPYQIINGRHRVYMAHKMKLKELKVIFI